ncbi:MAG TPA: transporter substrate-binding domain-containing protein [Actinomycetota bacterium]|nr:transporter substrate-binding domain-containing protein [Actinomycetota bacterium]
MRRSRLFPLALVLACAGACVPPVPDNDEFTRFDEETVMGVIQDAGVLVVGLPEEVGLPWAALSGDDATGFAPDVAADIAESLRVDLEFREAPNDELVDLVDQGDVDVAFPVLTVTEELVRGHAFSDPIYVSHQRLLVPARSGIETAEDLDGEVCSPIDDATGVELHTLNPSAATVPLKPGNAAGCIPLLEDGLADAATATDVLLAAMIARLPDGFEVTGEQLTTEPLGVSLESGASGWVDYVNKIITEFDQEGRWAASYEQHFRPLLGGETPEPPIMTVEEAAALFPADLEE